MIKKIISAACAAVITITGTSLCVRREPKLEPTTATTTKLEIGGAYYSVTHNEFIEICSVVMAEAGGECYKGQQAVAQVILNTCKIEHCRPFEAIAGHGYTKKRPSPTKSVMDAVDDVFYRGAKVIDERVTIFYAPSYGTSEYHESQIYSTTIGNHKFFIERRYK